MNRSKREDYKRFVVFCLASLIIIAQTAIFAYVWYDFYSSLILKPFWRKGNWVLILIYALIYLMFAKLYGGLKVGYLKRIDVFYSLTLASICTNVVTYFQITLINRWFLAAGPIIEMTLVQIVVTILWIWGSRFIYSRLYGARRLLVIYGDRDPGDVIHKMNTRKDKYDISGKVHIREGEEKIHAMMEDYEGVIIWDLPSQIRNKYLKYCFSHSIRCYMSPKISDIILLGTDRIHLFDTPLLMCRNQGLSMEQRAAKRLLDIVVSGLGIIVSSPIMLIIAIAVKAYDGGPVFYLQDRLTYRGKEFRIRKFRSMCVDSEKNGARLASKHDSRITPVGHVLRNLHLDELPQLFNVFAGDMSLVGPRPERDMIMQEYEQEIPEFHYFHIHNGIGKCQFFQHPLFHHIILIGKCYHIIDDQRFVISEKLYCDKNINNSTYRHQNSGLHTYNKHQQVQQHHQNRKIQWPVHEVFHRPFKFDFVVHCFFLFST